MSALAASVAVYSQAARTLGTPRSIELKVFSQINGRLVRHNGDPSSFPKLVEALHDNLALWTAIMADVADSRNGLPRDLRAKLLFLGEFTRAHTQKVVRRDADAQPLIDVNNAIIRGLRGQTAA